MRTVLVWFLLAGYALGTVATIASIGKPRTTITPGYAAISAFINGLVIAGIAVWLL